MTVLYIFFCHDLCSVQVKKSLFVTMWSVFFFPKKELQCLIVIDNLLWELSYKVPRNIRLMQTLD